ncbi:MAG: ice-binding family protein [Minisyncoccia bacterium]
MMKNKLMVVIVLVAFFISIAGSVFAATFIDLNTADDFAVLAGSTITNSGSSVITGDLGLSPGLSVTGFPPGTVSGTQHIADAAAVQAKVDLTSAYNDAAGQTPVSTVPTELGGTTKNAGIYDSADGTFEITGTLTLDAQGDPNAVFIFKTATTLNTAGASSIVLANDAQACNVFWQVGSSATLGANSTFKGNILALTSVTLTTGADVEGRVLARNGAVTLDTNDIAIATCAASPQLTVTKTVDNTGGGTKLISDFPLFIDGSSVTSAVASTTTIGLHTVTETTDPNYTSTIGGDCAANGTITLAMGEEKTCSITNTYVPASPGTLHIIKQVTNNNGGTAIASDFTLNVTGTNVSSSSFSGSAAGVDITLDAGSYTVTEPIIPTGYLQSGSGTCSGTIASGETITCTITNDDVAPQLIVNKIVINDNGRTKLISDFPLFIDGSSVVSGVASTTTIGSHTVTETTDSNYTSAFGGDCAADGTVSLALGEVKTCTVTNDDVTPPSSGGGSRHYAPPLIDIIKIPSPLALPKGPGSVTYTYTLSNIGTVPVSDITMVDDSCSPVSLISGDTNADNMLDLDEAWIYRCSKIISKTSTNIVTATGWSHGVSATDIANATVVVGVSVVPPLIHVTKIPNPLTLPAEGGIVTYTNKVTNPGTVSLSNVRLTDDKCSPVKYISGDLNNNSKLETTETWIYTCQSKLTKTTVNTVTASGDANSLTAKDFAIATVIVAAPKLPNTGIGSDEGSLLWYIIALAGIFLVLLYFYFIRRKK